MDATTARAGPAIRIDGLRYAYAGGTFRMEVRALEVERGARTACVGPSGTGKTTLVHLIAGVLRPEAGTVHVAGRDLGRMTDAEVREFRIANIGMVFQEFELLDYLSSLDNILLPYRVASALVLDRSVRSRARELAGAMGIDHVLTRRPARLSQGERQRVALCRALVTQPALLLCDEATGNLDPESAARGMSLLFDAVAARGATLFLVTHDHSVLDRFEQIIDTRELFTGGSVA